MFTNQPQSVASHESAPADHPLFQLSADDLDLIVALVLESGSIKGLAKRYDVSYPTIRARLDAVISRLKRILDGNPRSPLADLLATLVERGELTPGNARKLLAAAKQSPPPLAITNHE